MMGFRRVRLSCLKLEKCEKAEIEINGVYIGKGIIEKDGIMQIVPAVFQLKPDKDGRGICYASEGFVLPLPDKYIPKFNRIKEAFLPLNVNVTW